MSDAHQPNSEEVDFQLLVEFLRVAAALSRGKTLSDVSKKLHKSRGRISQMFKDLDSHLQEIGGHPLLMRRPGMGGGTELTPQGQLFVQRVRSQFRELLSKRPQFSMACAENLITNRVLSPIFALGPSRKHLDYDLRLETRVDFRQLLEHIRTEQLDLACLWGTASRTSRVPAGIDCDTQTAPFDLVFISHDLQIVSQVNRIIERIAGSKLDSNRMAALEQFMRTTRCARLTGDAQPLKGLFERFAVGYEPIVVDTYDSVSACVRSRVADLAVVPAIYPNLIRLRTLGEVFFSLPVETISVALFFLEHRRNVLAPVIELVKARLADFPREAPALRQADLKLPTLCECRNLTYGYYIDLERQEDVKVEGEGPVFRWREERLEWQAAAGDEPRLIGTITNYLDHRFSANLHCSEQALVLQADREQDLSTQQALPGSVQQFTSVFNVPLEQGVVYGIWTIGKTRFEMYGTILSDRRLTLQDLRRMQHAMDARAILTAHHAVEGVDIRTLPSDRPLQ